MQTFITLEQIDQAADYIRSQITTQPRIGLILGSGLSSLADSIQEAVRVPFQEIPNWPVSTVQGHAGKLVVGLLENTPVMVMQGRVHYYEGYSISQVGFPVRVLTRLGIQSLIVTNAAGGINPEFDPGDLMLITDHLSLISMGGENPLRGPNLDEFGPRFPDMSQAYDREYLTAARSAAKKLGLNLREGVYGGLAGPSFETPADIRYLKLIGADAVGMSTVPEVIVARHAGLRVLGISGISNKANLDGNTITTHQEVLEAGLKITPALTTLIREILSQGVL